MRSFKPNFFNSTVVTFQDYVANFFDWNFHAFSYEITNLSFWGNEIQHLNPCLFFA